MDVVFLRSNPVNPDPRVEKEVSSLLEQGHTITILCWDRFGELPREGNLTFFGKTLRVHRWRKKADFGGGLKNIFKLFFFQIFLLRKLFWLRKRFDVVHAADFDTVLPGLVMKLIFRKKLVYDIYDFYIDSFSVPAGLKSTIKKLDYFAIKMADVVIITNDARVAQIKGSKPKKLFVIHNTPMEPRDVQYEYSDASSEFDLTAVYVGILQPGRLLQEIIKIFSKYPRWKLIIAGFGILEDEISYAAQKFENIKFLGKVDYSHGLKLSASADFLFATYDPAIPNHKFSSPNKLYEAMMLSKPIIVCNGTGIDIIVNDGNTGLSIDYAAVDFENAVKFLSANVAISEKMAANARKLYDEQYSWSVMGRKLIDIYDEI